MARISFLTSVASSVPAVCTAATAAAGVVAAAPTKAACVKGSLFPPNTNTMSPLSKPFLNPGTLRVLWDAT